MIPKPFLHPFLFPVLLRPRTSPCVSGGGNSAPAPGSVPALCRHQGRRQEPGLRKVNAPAGGARRKFCSPRPSAADMWPPTRQMLRRRVSTLVRFWRLENFMSQRLQSWLRIVGEPPLPSPKHRTFLNGVQPPSGTPA